MMNNRNMYRVPVLLLGLCLLLSGCGGGGKSGEDATATSMRLRKTEGEVQVSDDQDKNLEAKADLALYDGYGVETEKKSYGWVELDSVKLLKMDELSRIGIEKEGGDLKVRLRDGNLFFHVAEPLKSDESMEIRTSTMAIGIRGTCGWVEASKDGATKVSILEGKVECTAGDKSAFVSAGEMAYIDGNGEIAARKFDVSVIPAFVLDEAKENDALDDMIKGLPKQGGDDAAANPAAGQGANAEDTPNNNQEVNAETDPNANPEGETDPNANPEAEAAPNANPEAEAGPNAAPAANTNAAQANSPVGENPIAVPGENGWTCYYYRTVTQTVGDKATPIPPGRNSGLMERDLNQFWNPSYNVVQLWGKSGYVAEAKDAYGITYREYEQGRNKEAMKWIASFIEKNPDSLLASLAKQCGDQLVIVSQGGEGGDLIVGNANGNNRENIIDTQQWIEYDGSGGTWFVVDSEPEDCLYFAISSWMFTDIEGGSAGSEQMCHRYLEKLDKAGLPSIHFSR